MIKVPTLLILFLFTVTALACDDKVKPKLKLEKISEHQSSCTSYYVVIPQKYKDTKIKDIVLASKEPAMHFYLERLPDEDMNLVYSLICVTQTVLKQSELALYYQEPIGEDGSMKLCIDEYKYTNLSQYIE